MISLSFLALDSSYHGEPADKWIYNLQKDNFDKPIQQSTHLINWNLLSRC